MRSCLLLILLLSLLSTPATAQDDFFEPASMGMGGAVRNLGVDASAIHLNPASMTGKPKYIAGSNYTFYGREKSHTIASGAFDSRTSNFAMGTEYTIWTFAPVFEPETDLNWFPTQLDKEIEDKRTWQRWDIAVGYALWQRRINVGLTARIVRQQFAIRDNRTFFTLDGGVTFWPVPVIAVGVSVQNLIPTKEDRFPIRLSPGVALELPNALRVGFDMVFQNRGAGEPAYKDVHVGVEGTIVGAIHLRGGFYSERQFTETYVTWGLGLTIAQAKITLGYAMRIEVGPMDRGIREDKPDNNSRILNTVGFDFRF
jgi:hypothetical protein